jgi:diguanylate cyclase (GGDEF)-like protein/PAS domain S-box-containing protein
MESKIRDRLIKIMDLLVDAVCIVDADGRFVFVNAACERTFGYKPEEMIGRNMIDLVHPEDRTRTMQAVDRIMDGFLQQHFENRYLRKDGRVVHLMWSARWSDDDQLRLAVARDITELKHAQIKQNALYEITEAAHAAENLVALYERIHRIVAQLLRADNFFVALYDASSNVLSFPYFVDQYDRPPLPHAFESGTLSAEVIRGRKPILLTRDNVGDPPMRGLPIHGHECSNWLGVPLTSQKSVIGALVVQSYTDDVRYTEQDKDLLLFVSAQIASAIERKQNETQLQYLARHDTLTELPNRKTFDDRVEVALARARHEHSAFAILYVDLDGFKQVNDRFGHAVGDQLLCKVTQRMVHCVRASDTVGRIGGDEFTILIDGIERADQAEIVAAKVRATFEQPFRLDDHLVNVSPSIGIAVYPDHGVSQRQLLQCADAAMYAAKRGGGNCFRMAGNGQHGKAELESQADGSEMA